MNHAPCVIHRMNRSIWTILLVALAIAAPAVADDEPTVIKVFENEVIKGDRNDPPIPTPDGAPRRGMKARASRKRSICPPPRSPRTTR
jgi:hypothetical protein